MVVNSYNHKLAGTVFASNARRLNDEAFDVGG